MRKASVKSKDLDITLSSLVDLAREVRFDIWFRSGSEKPVTVLYSVSRSENPLLPQPRSESAVVVRIEENRKQTREELLFPGFGLVSGEYSSGAVAGFPGSVFVELKYKDVKTMIDVGRHGVRRYVDAPPRL